MLQSHKIIILPLLAALFVSCPAEAQVRAASRTLEQMLTDAGRKGLRIERNGVMELGNLCPDKQMRVEMKDAVVQDMGIILFPETMDKSYATPVYGFIERYLLALLLKGTQTEQRRLLQEDTVTLKVNGRNYVGSKYSLSHLLQSVDSLSSFRLTSDMSHFRAQWQGTFADIELAFPKQYDLILGRDKKELAETFRAGLEAVVCRKPEITYVPQLSQRRITEKEHVYVDMGDTYIIPQMQNGRFLKRQNSAFDYVFNEQMVKESLMNLFGNADEMGRKQALSLTVKGYRLSETFPFGADCLCAFMKTHNCTAYTGLETETDKEVTGTVMYVNRDLMYLHLLYFRFPKAAFGRESVPVDATLYPYIPVNNLSTLYDDMSDYHKKY
jgi:hypothetical protein